jgi:hypothetical protein
MSLRHESAVRPAGTGQVFKKGKLGVHVLGGWGSTYVGLGFELVGVGCVLAEDEEVSDLLSVRSADGSEGEVKVRTFSWSDQAPPLEAALLGVFCSVSDMVVVVGDESIVADAIRSCVSLLLRGAGSKKR